MKMAAFLNGCYGYLHTRYGVELMVGGVAVARALTSLLSPVTDAFHWRRCGASPLAGPGRRGELCTSRVCFPTMMMMMVTVMMMITRGKALSAGFAR